MPDETRKHLEDLHSRLTKAAEAGNQEAEEMAGRVDAYLAATEPTEEEHRDLLEAMGDTARRFEVDHPRLSHTLQSVIDSLTASGI